MITVQEARNLVAAHTSLLPARELPLTLALGRTLREDIYAPVSIPAFEQSAMDGYAFLYEGWKQYGVLQIVGEMAAGAQQAIALDPQQAVRIFTGAPLPAGADTVVTQERVSVKENVLTILDADIKTGANIRPTGSEVTKGEKAMGAGTLLMPGAIGFLAGIGVGKAMMTPSPVVAVIANGNELIKPEEVLQFGQVYESNSSTLQAALRQMQINEISMAIFGDKVDALRSSISSMLKHSDVLLITGGISVGDYDLVTTALKACGVETVFHKIKQKPGKPLYFGTKGTKLVFGLPGNPASAFTCFYEYVYPCLRQMMGYQRTGLLSVHLPLVNSFAKKARLTQFLKGRREDAGVRILGAQESYRMQAFNEADCLVVLPEEGTEWRQGEMVEVHLLPSL